MMEFTRQKDRDLMSRVYDDHMKTIARRNDLGTPAANRHRAEQTIYRRDARRTTRRDL